MPKDRNTIAFIKKMLEEGYTQKQVKMITKEHQSRIQRIAAKKTYQYISSNEYIEVPFFEHNKRTLDTILSYPEMAGHGPLNQQDINYIRLIKYCGGTYSGMKFIYADRSHRELRNIWLSSLAFSPQEFDATRIGLTNEDIYFLLS